VNAICRRGRCNWHGVPVANLDGAFDNSSMRTPYSYRQDSAVPRFADDRPIIIFDGLCVLCSTSAAFVLRHDKAAVFRLLAAQSPLGTALYSHYGLDPQNYETMILIADGVGWFKSEAAIRIAKGLGVPWSFACVFRIVPLRWRDRFYAWVARNRFKWLGRRDSCFLPDSRHADRFLA
jgi:predicted DCC family thiol-disulfide oxidoreductase YuxK